MAQDFACALECSRTSRRNGHMPLSRDEAAEASRASWRPRDAVGPSREPLKSPFADCVLELWALGLASACAVQKLAVAAPIGRPGGRSLTITMTNNCNPLSDSCVPEANTKRNQSEKGNTRTIC